MMDFLMFLFSGRVGGVSGVGSCRMWNTVLFVYDCSKRGFCFVVREVILNN